MKDEIEVSEGLEMPDVGSPDREKVVDANDFVSFSGAAVADVGADETIATGDEIPHVKAPPCAEMGRNSQLGQFAQRSRSPYAISQHARAMSNAGSLVLVPRPGTETGA